MKKFISFSHPKYKSLFFVQIVWIILLGAIFCIGESSFPEMQGMGWFICIPSAVGNNPIFLLGFLFYLIKGILNKCVLLCSNPVIILLSILLSAIQIIVL